MSDKYDFEEILEACEGLLTILRRLREPDGCPWDRKQTEESLAPLVLEEAFEMADAVSAGRGDKVCEEMGDLFMNTFMTGMIAEDSGRFSLKEVFEKISAKLVHRHPHVFGDRGRADGDRGRADGNRVGVDAVLTRWEDIKRGERQANNEDPSAVAGVPRAMPGLLRAFRVGEKIRRTNPDLPPFREPLRIAADGLETLAAADEKKLPVDRREKALGGILLALCNAASLMGLNPEMALRASVEEEEETFRRVETELGENLPRAAAETIDRLWKE